MAKVLKPWEKEIQRCKQLKSLWTQSEKKYHRDFNRLFNSPGIENELTRRSFFRPVGLVSANWASLAVLQGDPSGWQRFNNAAAMFYAAQRQDGRPEAHASVFYNNTELLTALACYLFGYPKRAAFMAGRIHLGLERDRDNIRRHLPRLLHFILERTLKKDNFPLLKSRFELGPYEKMLTHWNDDKKFSEGLIEALDYHKQRQSDRGDGEIFCYYYKFVPIEILALKKLRLSEGLSWPEVEHIVLAPPIPPVPKGPIPVTDPDVSRAIAYAESIKDQAKPGSGKRPKPGLWVTHKKVLAKEKVLVSGDLDAIDEWIDSPDCIIIDWKDAADTAAAFAAGALPANLFSYSEQDGVSMHLECNGRTLDIPLKNKSNDNARVLLAVNRILKPDYEIHVFATSVGDDTTTALLRTREWWDVLRTKHAEAYAETFVDPETLRKEWGLKKNV